MVHTYTAPNQSSQNQTHAYLPILPASSTGLLFTETIPLPQGRRLKHGNARTERFRTTTPLKRQNTHWDKRLPCCNHLTKNTPERKLPAALKTYQTHALDHLLSGTSNVQRRSRSEDGRLTDQPRCAGWCLGKVAIHKRQRYAEVQLPVDSYGQDPWDFIHCLLLPL